jgi:heme A synthase
LILVIWASRSFGLGSPVFRGASAAFVFLLIEAGIGAGIVLRELVADNDSASRAVAVSIHLTNTLLLTGFAAYTAWLASGGLRGSVRAGRSAPAYALGLTLMVFISMAGAVTALGDTLFPMEPALGPGLFDKVAADLSATNHFLVRLRAVHPAAAIAGSVYLLWLFASGARAGGWARFVWMAVAGELLIGVVNVTLAAPGWMQLVHLAAAHGLWIVTLLASLEAVPLRRTVEAAAPAASRV